MVNEGVLHLKFSDNFTVSNISTAYDMIEPALRGGADVELDIADLGEADLTFVQLLESARRTAAACGRALYLRQAARGPVLQTLQRGGFLDPEDRERLDFWLNGANPQ